MKTTQLNFSTVFLLEKSKLDTAATWFVESERYMSTKDCGQVVAALCGHIHFSRHKLSALDKFFFSLSVCQC